MKRHTAPHRLGAALLAGALLAASAPLAAQGLQITRPLDGQTIHDNSGNLDVFVAGGGDAAGFRVYLDGAPIASGPQPAFRLEGIDRGEHSLRAVSLDEDGREIDSSAPITFYMWQASRLFPNRR